ncbi:hypothetical protein [Sporosarcina limicola]|uniref:Uncharacterized protein n=1 Tax=Sporosarcina limicola TaxID=34101 RepID=A0A927R531_9BACL|nr:hypothetical protein [Sporosarcina limicola]MBE1553499.1 hypothetical protein [Sporosarcina limicola]
MIKCTALPIRLMSATFRRRPPHFYAVQLQWPDAWVISRTDHAAKNAALPFRLMPVAGLQEVGHVAIAAGRGGLRLRSFSAIFAFLCLHSFFYLYILVLVPSANPEGETIENA